MSEALRNLRAAADEAQVYLDRPRDISFLLGQLAEFERRVPALAGHLDPGRIGVAGHSLGAHTALALAGMPVEAPGSGRVDLSDGRVRAVIALSPLGEGRFQMPLAGRRVSRPVLLVTGTDDEQPLDEDHALAWRLQAWAELPPGDKFLCVISEAHHMTFAGGGMGRKADARHLEAVQRISDLFWAAQLHSDATAAVSLATGPSLSLPVRWESKLNGSDVSEKTYTTGP